VAERQLPKLNVAGSIPVSRSTVSQHGNHQESRPRSRQGLLNYTGCNARGGRGMATWCGAVAQLGERLVRNEEVSGSIPLSSTNQFSRKALH
jgi:hypothetical protein